MTSVIPLYVTIGTASGSVSLVPGPKILVECWGCLEAVWSSHGLSWTLGQLRLVEPVFRRTALVCRKFGMLAPFTLGLVVSSNALALSRVHFRSRVSRPLLKLAEFGVNFDVVTAARSATTLCGWTLVQ